jgi:multidrug efflux pump subunit AcrB
MMPQGLKSKIMWDNSIYIKQSIEEVKKTIITASLCVIAVVFIFICSWRMLLIPLVTIPLSLIGVFGVMLAMGYSLNTITFLSLVLAIGMVVDDAIVVSENVHRHIAMGKSPFDAAIFGAREIQFAVISMTFTLAAVYAPIGFLTGLLGSLFKEFAFTLASAVIISGFVALTLSPMMCSKFLRADTAEGKLAKLSHTYFDKIMHAYRRALDKVLHHRITVVVTMVAILLFSGVFYKLIPAELAPREDIGAIVAMITAPTSAGLAYTEKYVKYLSPILKSVPEKVDYLAVNGANGVNTALAILVLKPWSERKRTANDIIKELYPKFWAVPGITAYPASQIGRASCRERV